MNSTLLHRPLMSAVGFDAIKLRNRNTQATLAGVAVWLVLLTVVHIAPESFEPDHREQARQHY